MIRLASICVVCAVGAVVAFPAEPGAAGQKGSFEDGVKKVAGSFTPAEAKPGQTVTFTITVELNEGYHTYPTVQSDKGAENFVNVIRFPKSDKVVFVGALQDPKDLKSKADPDIKAVLQFCTGKVVYTQKAVVSPKASPGDVSVKLATFNLNVCDDKNCFFAKKPPVVEASLKVLEGPAVPVEKDYAEEVKKALGDK
jgi:hypothetical protein